MGNQNISRTTGSAQVWLNPGPAVGTATRMTVGREPRGEKGPKILKGEIGAQKPTGTSTLVKVVPSGYYSVNISQLVDLQP